MQKAFQVQTQFLPEANLPEQAGYFAVPGANLYAVLHPVTAPIARVLLVGAFASERHFSYHAWVRWARYLAARRVEVLRYDYRGIGESTGLFEEMSFEDWGEDVKILADQFARRSPRVPLVLHGLELGAILAARRFHEGTGDGLLLWSAPANANQVLYSALVEWAGTEQRDERSEAQKKTSEYIRELEQGGLVEVQGYRWSGRLWRDSFDFDLPLGMEDECVSRETYKKPVKIVQLGKDAVPIVRARLSSSEELNWLYSSNFDWVAGTVGLPPGGHNEGSD